MQRRVDGRSHAVLAESAEGIQLNHFVFERDATITALEANELVHEKCGKAAALDASEVAAATLHPQNVGGSAADRVGLNNFRAGVSAAEIRYPQVRSEKVRAIAKQFRLVTFRGDFRVPQIL